MYRAFALLAFASLVLLGAPLGVWIAARGGPAPLVWLHGGVQLFGFFGTLIAGVAHHLLPRFTGRPVRATALTPWLLTGLASALVFRLAGVVWPVLATAGAALHASAFVAFAAWVWRMLDPPPLRLLRAQLTLSSAWLAGGAALEVWLRARGGGLPDAAGMQTVSVMALVGVLGWVLGVLLRAGPMFVRDWRVPTSLARATPWMLTLSVAFGIAGVLDAGSLSRARVLARCADVVTFAILATAIVGAGGLRPSRDALPMLSRSVPETRIFRVAVASALVGVPVSLWALALGADAPRALTDAIRHLLAIGVVGAVVIAMTFRLIPVLEGRPLPWPALRAVALWALAGAVVVRTGQALLPAEWGAMVPLVAVSGVLTWSAFACAGVNLMVVPRAAAGPGPERP